MARKDTAAADPAAIDPEAVYRITVAAPLPFAGLRFGPNADNQVSGELLAAILASDEAGKVTGYTPV